MEDNKYIFVNKKILIYGMGRSGISSYNFLKKNNDVRLYDDNKLEVKNKKTKKLLIKKIKLVKKNFDFIVISPGIDINRCNLKKFLKKNIQKIVTDLDIFYSCYSNNKNITITGTNGKSTTAKLLYDVLKDQENDARLTGNIGNPILSEKKITIKTIFVIEASSYQIDYSKVFKANFALILNISPDHLERHGTLKKYIEAKFKLIKNQTNKDFSFLDINNRYLKKEIKSNRINSKIINVNNNQVKKYLKKIKNSYLRTGGNLQNLSFIFALAKKFKLNKKVLFKTLDTFKSLKFRQQIIYQSKKITLINDSKATSFSSSINILKSLKNVYWIIGGIPKTGDKFILSKKECSGFKAYIFSKNKNYFIKQLKNKMNYQCFNNLKDTLKKIISDIKLETEIKHRTILFSPSAASFDSFKNFEDRGEKFNLVIKKINIKKLMNDE